MLGVDSSRCDIRYNKEKIIKRPGLKSGQILTEDNLPKLNPIKPILGRREMVKTILEKINNTTPCYSVFRERQINCEKRSRFAPSLP